MPALAQQCPGTSINGDRVDGLVHGTMCRVAIEDLPECMANHYTVEATQLDGGDFHCHSDFVSSAGAVLCLETIAREVHLTGTMKDDWLGLGISVRTKGSRFMGERADDERVPMTLCGSSFEWFIRPGFQLLIVLAGRSRVLRLAERSHVSPFVTQAIGPDARTTGLRTDPRVVDGSRRSLLGLLHAAHRGELEVSAAAFETAVLEEIITVLDSSDGENPGTIPAATLVRRAQEVVGSLPKKFKISALCAELNVGPRTLGKAFCAVTGVSPYTFFLRQRLNAARTQLLRADPERDKVTNIALGLGFTELGRFAVRYRELFGESPSQTLRRQMRYVPPLSLLPALPQKIAQH